MAVGCFLCPLRRRSGDGHAQRRGVLLGVYFEPDTLRVLWIVLAGVSTAAGLAMLVGVQRMARAIQRGEELSCPMMERMKGSEQQVAE